MQGFGEGFGTAFTPSCREMKVTENTLIQQFGAYIKCGIIKMLSHFTDLLSVWLGEEGLVAFRLVTSAFLLKSWLEF